MATQKLLLIEDVEGLGRSGDVVTAKPGFVRNYLLPKGKAKIADANTLRMQARLQEERRKRAAEDRKASEAIRELLDGKTYVTEVKVDHDGHMYGSVSTLDIVRIVHEHDNVELEKRFVQLPHGIKTTGVHRIDLRLKEDVVAHIIVKVVPEGMGEAAEAMTEHTAEVKAEEAAEAAE
ncbi:MAG: 50S ribosomal protein L9 [Chlamydiia bacterium]|nr:50S ribosomal protein L9 [Chlamydiia bacterium]